MADRWAFAKDCCLCRKRDAFLGKLLGPVGEDKATGEALFVHRLCAIWSPEVYQTNEGTIKNFRAAFKRGRGIKCMHCRKRGATIGCVVERCQCSYHLSCAKAAGCHFLPMRYLLSCPDHTAILTQSAMLVFKEEKAEALGPITKQPFIVPTWAIGSSAQQQEGQRGAAVAGDSRPPEATAEADGAARDGKRKRTGREREIHEHVKAARTALNRFKAARKLGVRIPGYDSDEERFAANERARYAHDKEALRGTQLGGGAGKESAGASAGQVPPPPAAAAPGAAPPPPAAPVAAPGAAAAAAGALTCLAPGWEAVGGLSDAVRQLKEMVLLPLAYPLIFQSMNLTPPRGILLHGSPGCGKTLLARALYGACQKCSDASITFFSRKGADCLGEFAGDAERNIRILFEEAAKNAPSIIFLDELDALVPSRSSREGGSDQMYASVVTTLLSVMDGVMDRGNVVVIGATNRPDSIDGALRRPGRFDREVYVGLPDAKDRNAILRVQTNKWERRPSKKMLRAVAESTEGFAGADLSALCTAAVMEAIRRRLPDIADIVADEQKQMATCTRAPHHPGAERHPAQGSAAAEGPGVGVGAVDPGAQVAAGSSSSSSAAAAAAAVMDGGEGGSVRQALDRILADVTVAKEDWATALRQAPAPCSLRQGVASLAADAASPLPHHAAPLLLRLLGDALSTLHGGGLPLPGRLSRAAAAAASAAALCSGDGGAPSADDAAAEALSEFEAVLVREGAAEAPLLPLDSASGGGEHRPPPNKTGATEEDEEHPSTHTASSSWPGSSSSSSSPPCRLLLAGEDEAAMRAVAGAVLLLASGGEGRTVIGLPQMLDAGAGNLEEGAVVLIRNAVTTMKTGAGPLVFFLPHLEAWAMDVITVEEEDDADDGDDGDGDDDDEDGSNKLHRQPSGRGPPTPGNKQRGRGELHHDKGAGGGSSPPRGGICPLPSTYSHDYFAGIQPPRGLVVAAAAKPGAAAPGGDEDMCKVEVEAACLTALWHTVQAAVSELCFGRPAIIIGTCSRPVSGIPDDLIRFFSRGAATTCSPPPPAAAAATTAAAAASGDAAAAASGDGDGGGGFCGGSPPPGVVDCSLGLSLGLIGSSSSSSSALIGETETRSSSLIASRLGDRAAAAAVAEVAAALRAKADSQQQQRTMGAQAAAAALRPSSSSSTRRQWGPEASTEAGGDDGAAPSTGARLSKEAPGPDEAKGPGASLPKASSVNEATLAWGRKMNAQVQTAIRVMGFRLLQDRRARVARLPATSAAPRLQLSRGSRRSVDSFVGLAKAMAAGKFKALRDVSLAVEDLTLAMQQAAPAAAQRSRRRSARQNPGRRGEDGAAADGGGSLYAPFKACAAAIKDDIDAWAFSLRSRVGLSTPAAAAAIAAAQEEQKKEEEEEQQKRRQEQEENERLKQQQQQEEEEALQSAAAASAVAAADDDDANADDAAAADVDDDEHGIAAAAAGAAAAAAGGGGDAAVPAAAAAANDVDGGYKGGAAAAAAAGIDGDDDDAATADGVDGGGAAAAETCAAAAEADRGAVAVGDAAAAGSGSFGIPEWQQGASSAAEAAAILGQGAEASLPVVPSENDPTLRHGLERHQEEANGREQMVLSGTADGQDDLDSPEAAALASSPPPPSPPPPASPAASPPAASASPAAACDGGEGGLVGAAEEPSEGRQEAALLSRREKENARLIREWSRSLFEQLRPSMASLAGVRLPGAMKDDPMAFMDAFVASGAQAGRELSRGILSPPEESAPPSSGPPGTPLLAEGSRDKESPAADAVPSSDLLILPDLQETEERVIDSMRRSRIT